MVGEYQAGSGFCIGKDRRDGEIPFTGDEGRLPVEGAIDPGFAVIAECLHESGIGNGGTDGVGIGGLVADDIGRSFAPVEASQDRLKGFLCRVVLVAAALRGE